MPASLPRRLAAAGSALAAAASVASAQLPTGYVAGMGSGASLCDRCAITSTITLDAPGTVLATGNNVTVRLDNLSHTFFADLVATLIYTPFGGGGTVSATLFSRVGGGGDPRGTYSFNDGHPTWVGSIGYAGGDFAPGTLGAFNGVGVAGDWTLHIQDMASGDAGSFASWGLELATDAPIAELAMAAAAPVTTTPEPGTWALMGTGLLGVAAAAARRRRTA